MIRAKELHGRAVVDLDTAAKLGEVVEVVLDPESRRVAAFHATEGQPILGGLGHRDRLIIPASAVQAIGEDAITISRRAEGLGGGAVTDESASFESLPLLSHVVGRKVVTEGGSMAGEIDDVLIEEQTGRIVGYSLQEHTAAGGLGGLFAPAVSGDRRRDYIRADADLRVGPDLVVVPDGSIVRHEVHDEVHSRADAQERSTSQGTGWGGWAAPARQLREPSVWSRPTETPSAQATTTHRTGLSAGDTGTPPTGVSPLGSTDGLRRIP